MARLPVATPPSLDVAGGIPRDLRIAFVAPSLARGWRFQPLFKALAEMFPGTVVFTGRWPGFTGNFRGTFEVRQQPGLRFLTLKRRWTGTDNKIAWLSLAAFWELLRFRPYAVFTNGFGLFTVFALLVKALVGCRVILLWQGISMEAGGNQRGRLAVRRLMGRFMDAAVSNTRDGAEYLRKRVGIAPAAVSQWAFEVPSREALCSGGGVTCFSERCRPVFMYVGRLVRGKGVQNLLEACHILVADGLRDFSVVVVGEGAHQEELRQRARVLGIEGLVQWCGFVPYDQMGQFYQACDVLVLPSIEDNWGVVVPEAMLFQKPILCSLRAGSSELVRHGVNGFVFDPSQPLELAGYMKQFIRNRGLIAEFGLASQETMRLLTPTQAARVLGMTLALKNDFHSDPDRPLTESTKPRSARIGM